MIVVFVYGTENQYRLDVTMLDGCPEKRERFKKWMPLFKKKSFLRGFDSTSILHPFLLEA